MADEEEFSHSIQRALGRLEGQIGALETRVTNLDTRTERQFNLIAGKMASMEESIGKVAAAITTFKSKLTGNWQAIAIIAACVMSLLMLGVSIVNLFKH